MVKIGDRVEAGRQLVVMKTRDAEDSLKDNQARLEQKRLSLQKLQESYQDAVHSGDEKMVRNMARDIEIIKLDLQILERQIANVQRQLAEFSRLIAPVSGIVTEVHAVKGAPVPSGRAAVIIADLSKGQQLKATIDNAKSQYLTVGDETDIRFEALNNARVKAKITDIRDATDDSVQPGQKRKEITFSLRDDRLKGGEIRDRQKNSDVSIPPAERCDSRRRSRYLRSDSQGEKGAAGQ